MSRGSGSDVHPSARSAARPGLSRLWLEWIRQIPPEAVLVGVALFAILAIFAAADPVSSVTSSVAPFTDEAGNFVNARNFVQVGQWSTDQWNLYLVNLPFSLVEVAAFKLIGVGLVQARLAMIVCVSLTTVALIWGLRGAIGRACATFAGLAFAFSGLILYYGRLAFLEDLVVLGLTMGTLVLARDSRLNLRSGLFSGACFAVAIGTKPSALYAVVGIVGAMGLVWGRRDPGMRRWIAGAVGVIVAAGLVWLVVVGLPNQAAIAVDIKIWPVYKWSLTPGALISSVVIYLTWGNDHLYGFLLLPLIVLSFVGLVSIVVLRRRLTGPQAKLSAAAFAWAAFGFGVLMVVSYRPNRYVVPLVPAMAILAAIGLNLFQGWLREHLAERGRAASAAGSGAWADTGSLVGSGVGGPDVTAEPGGSNRPGQSRRRFLPGAVVALAVVFAVAPGLARYAVWVRHATYAEVAIQSEYADAVPQGQMVGGGYAALFLMRSQARTLMVGLTNLSDLYAQGARWYLWNPTAVRPIGVSQAVWASAERVLCSSWHGGTVCLFHLR